MYTIDETPNQYRVRIIDPKRFTKLRTKTIGKNIQLIIGRIGNSKTTSVQAIHFNKNKWNKNNAMIWARKYVEEKQVRRYATKHKKGNSNKFTISSKLTFF